MAITQDQERAVRTALLSAPLGFVPKAEDLPACAAMVEAGVLRRVSVAGSDRVGFVATDEAMEALGEFAAMTAASN